jgi:hypothetical protein
LGLQIAIQRFDAGRKAGSVVPVVEGFDTVAGRSGTRHLSPNEFHVTARCCTKLSVGGSRIQQGFGEHAAIICTEPDDLCFLNRSNRGFMEVRYHEVGQRPALQFRGPLE